MSENTTTAQATTRRPWRTRAAIAGAGVLALTGGLMATNAYFTDQETIGPQNVGTATLSIGETSSPFAVEDLLPGVSQSETLSFENDGSVPFAYSIELDGIDPVFDPDDPDADVEDLLGWVTISVEVGSEVETGTLLNPPDAVTGTVDEGEDLDIDVAVGLVSDATNAAQDEELQFDVVIDATQVPQSPPTGS
ncbi:SipW-dependent-type signal peptide-containing protein [Nesterenkonia ebinurensis]|uniref:SipW-dependent-type signal peptide-containing protein n=1 Tax=Nesterenkonia ebinurensis TaxID=2608252 RepID=UPI00168B9FDC|nr:SipW-dependent-type signal peptide-containing protein [Nesterenkonia ebinurensis]